VPAKSVQVIAWEGRGSVLRIAYCVLRIAITAHALKMQTPARDVISLPAFQSGPWGEKPV